MGLSIGASSVKIAELKKKKSGWTLVGYGSAPLHEAISDQREVTNPAAIVSAIEEAMSVAKIRSKQVCGAVVGSGVIIKNLNIVVTDMKELNDSVFWEAEQYIPFDISEVVIDFQVLKKDKDQVEVLLVAVKRDFLDTYMGAIQEAKLTPQVMDVEVFALQNTFETNYDVSDTEAALLVDIGAMSTKTIICAAGVPLFTKDAPYGGMMITQEIQKELRLPSLQDAEALKVSENIPHEVAEITARICHVLAAELKKSVDFYTASSLGPPVTAVYLSGGGSRPAPLGKIIEDYLGVPVVPMNPFERIAVDSGSVSEDRLPGLIREAVIPIGLAIRGGDSKK